MFSRLLGLQGLVLAAATLTLITVGGCSGKSKEDSTSGPGSPVTEDFLGDSDSGNAGGLQTINFPYDSFALTSETRATLKANAEVLKDNPGVRVQIEGHCDQRGGIQYNIALGDKRADATRKYLMDMGISGDRLTTISFGKERPIDPGMSEGAWAKNRRANFVITAK